MALPYFNKKLSHYCEYCVHGKKSEYSDSILCLKCGITEKTDSCRHYKYDPLKRTPKRLQPNEDFTEDDFKL